MTAKTHEQDFPSFNIFSGGIHGIEKCPAGFRQVLVILDIGIGDMSAGDGSLYRFPQRFTVLKYGILRIGIIGPGNIHIRQIDISRMIRVFFAGTHYGESPNSN
jgi:hypothetical protein